jgi:hypothetical protein
MNELLDRILKHVTLKNILDSLAFTIIVLAIIPPYAEVYSVHLPAELLMTIGIALAVLKEAERRLQKRLASEPSTEQAQLINRLRTEIKQLRAERDTVTVVSQQWLSEPVALDGEKDE